MENGLAIDVEVEALRREDGYRMLAGFGDGFVFHGRSC
jgi:hypothetical protein